MDTIFEELNSELRRGIPRRIEQHARGCDDDRPEQGRG